MKSIEFYRVSKIFTGSHGQSLLRNYIADLLGFRDRRRQFYALKDVSFELSSGESLAIVGPNGAGKSTLLALVAGLARPDEGEVRVKGHIAALLELGSGFHHDLTGAENVRLNASLLGLTKKQTERRFAEILDFSGVGEFINEPLRTYSSGMIMRLAFSVAVNTDPDILLIDEVLAVGDQMFQEKCFERVRQLRRAGKSLVCVSHAVGMIQELCDRAIWLERGELVDSGSIVRVSEAYAARMAATV